MSEAVARIAPFADQVEDNEEAARLEALDRYDVLDTPREESLDRIARLIRDIFGVPVALVTVIDAHRQWYKSCFGLEATEVARQESFCRFTIRQNNPIIVPDAREDARFAENPNVVGPPFVRFYAGVPLTTPDGHNIGTICAIDFRPRQFTDREVAIFRDLAKVAMDELALRQLASVDSLTGALARRAFKEEGARSIALAQRHRHNLACVAFDLDHFKRVNDTYGHAAGDSVLASAVDVVRRHLRKSDIVGRLGGEEFAILLPHTAHAEAIEVAEKVRQALQRQAHTASNQRFNVTASFGVAALDRDTGDIDGLLGRADAALYRAKAAGRNQIVASEAGELRTKSVARRVLKSGRIIFNAYSSSIDCTVRLLSEDGATLAVSSSIGIPDKFTLAIRSDNIEAACRVIERTERLLEVEFY